MGQTHNRKLIINHIRRLQKLKERQALEGITVDPKVLIQIEEIEEEINKLQEESRVIVDSRPLLGIKNGKVTKLIYDHLKAIDDFLDEIYYSNRPHIPPHTYKSQWLLQDAGGQVFMNIGTKWAKKQGLKRDERGLYEVGIEPGMILELVSPLDFEDKPPEIVVFYE